MWCYRCITKVPWTDKVLNNTRLEEILRLMIGIKQRNLAYLGHVMRNNNYKILKNISQDKEEEARAAEETPGQRTRHMKKKKDSLTAVSLETLVVIQLHLNDLSIDLRKILSKYLRT